jgi:hypothetical protein
VHNTSKTGNLLQKWMLKQQKINVAQNRFTSHFNVLINLLFHLFIIIIEMMVGWGSAKLLAKY